ncbi:uncharacterized protein IWZ02DRAFT_458649 [Phyllosticta citriasiana]|uniref:uncharacterized protein n=1 Tax=Phyllosticta citriasiana TaxID=595635 RepID=UPI0030FDC7A8
MSYSGVPWTLMMRCRGDGWSDYITAIEGCETKSSRGGVWYVGLSRGARLSVCLDCAVVVVVVVVAVVPGGEKAGQRKAGAFPPFCPCCLSLLPCVSGFWADVWARLGR